MCFEPFKAGAEVRPSPAHRIELHPLAGLVRIDLLDSSVKVENVHTLRPLAFENRTRLSLSWRALMEPKQSTAIATSPTRSRTTPGR